MTKMKQDHFLDKLRRAFHPAPSEDEPRIWFCEIRILRELSTQAEAEVRRIKMHRGLNILWAAPEDPEAEQGLYPPLLNSS